MTTRTFFSKLRDALDPFWIVFAAFLITSYWFFIRMVFFDSGQVMQVFDVVRRIDPIGYDLVQMLMYPSNWLAGGSPYGLTSPINPYPPLATVLFAPLLSINIHYAYIFLVCISLVCFLGIAFLFPFKMSTTRMVTPTLVLIFVCGLSSYGFQFELERGSYNLISAAICFAGIFLFHKHPRLSLLAYALFTISIQLKLFPAIFILAFIRDWRDWKSNIIRFVSLGVVNIALFFILGWNVFLDFLNSMQRRNDNPLSWVGNHSISSAINFWLPGILKRFQISDSWLNKTGSELVQVLLLLFVLGLIFAGLIKAYKENKPGINPYLLFLCSCGALLIPSISHDYKLPLLVGPTALLLMDCKVGRSVKKSLTFFTIGLLFIFSLAYFSTQYSYVQKTPLLQNNFPAILGMMTIAFILYYLDPKLIQWGNGYEN